MIFYRAVDKDGLVHWVTVAGEAKAIDRNFEQHDVGNDKAALKEMLNRYEQQIHEAKNEKLSAVEPHGADVPSPGPGSDESAPGSSAPTPAPEPDPERPLKLTGIDADGYPKSRPAFTRVQVESLFNRRGEHVQDICYAISKLEGLDFGLVVYEVASRMTAPFMKALEQQALASNSNEAEQEAMTG